jgi:hypothetical protein
MMVRVIYKDQSAGVIERYLLENLIQSGRIVAYHHADRWIPVEVCQDTAAGNSGSVKKHPVITGVFS